MVSDISCIDGLRRRKLPVSTAYVVRNFLYRRVVRGNAVAPHIWVLFTGMIRFYAPAVTLF